MQRLKKERDDLWVLNFLHFFGGKAIFKREFFSLNGPKPKTDRLSVAHK